MGQDLKKGLPALHEPMCSTSSLELQSIKKGNETISSYLQRIKTVRDKLSAVGVHSDHEELLHVILKGLPKSMLLLLLQLGQEMAFFHWKSSQYFFKLRSSPCKKPMIHSLTLLWLCLCLTTNPPMATMPIKVTITIEEEAETPSPEAEVADLQASTIKASIQALLHHSLNNNSAISVCKLKRIRKTYLPNLLEARPLCH
jgi:hypothetical protein